MQHVMAHSALQGLRRIVLATRDAHGLYARFGFTPLARPGSFMEVWNPHVYATPDVGQTGMDDSGSSEPKSP